MPYTTDVSHDGRNYHLEIPDIQIPKCRACGKLLFTNSVDDQILRALRAHLGLLTPEQIRGGREALGLKANEFAERLGVAAETISRWERGGMIQSRAMDNLLRAYFAVPQVRAVLRVPGQDLPTADLLQLHEEAQAALSRLQCVICRYLAARPEGALGDEIRDALGLHSDFGGQHKGYLLWGLLGLLHNERRVRWAKDGRRRRWFLVGAPEPLVPASRAATNDA
jgi:putative zinc finger/helix-turn-helix YgiT family protein